ncbi:MAG: AMP-binding protein [Candidatus Aminicenantes bacterium]|nr:AMP-binding protein [Candidatus Aminicenantes bacterium]NIM77165.1 AMP-binding protein [Candidatus Aminicenantes bacterium]NIN16458.1 AMP-binding protein [Candidatus Aminicenantes bacterium]NIN40319.1 AMP-binding protein [Candidatus Aminicenantes bacterium]NIN83138.1 AMP-binding protein [Candidatus Aminicenantes bacterium]
MRSISQIEDCKNFSEVIYFHAKQNPHRVFIFDVRSERAYTFKEFNLAVEKTANYLISQGIQKGDRVTGVIENSPEYCFFYFAVIRVGAIFNPMPFTSHKEEILKNIRLVEPKLSFIDARKEREFEENEKKNIVFVPVGAERKFEEIIKDMGRRFAEPVDIDENTPACLYYSSGTTSDPKGVLFSHKNMIADISSICRGFKFSTENEVHLIMLPLGHTASTNYSLLPCVYIGGKIVMAESFWHIRTKIWKLIEEHRVTYMEVVPTVLYSILNIYRRPIDEDVSSMRFVGCGSAPLQKGVQEQFQERFHLKVGNLYGLSETGPTHIDDPLVPGWKSGSIGVPLDVNEVKIFDDKDKELGPNKTGEIVIKGDNVFVGYYKNEAVYNKVVKDDWFHTGDLGYKDKNGIFYFVDRKKDLIIKGGINIVPGEIDEVLMLHPAVKEGVTIGVLDEMFGEEVKSFVVPKDGMTITPAEIITHCSNYLPKTKVPKYVDIVNDIPKTHSGKLLRKKLRENDKRK